MVLPLILGFNSTVHAGAKPTPLLEAMQLEIDYAGENLMGPDDINPYYIAYAVTDTRSTRISATLGALITNDNDRNRILDIDLRVGDYELDNTHQIRGRGRFGGRFGSSSDSMLIEDDSEAIRHQLWLATDEAFKSALQRYLRVKTDLALNVEEEDQSDDFSREQPSQQYEDEVTISIDREEWADKLRRVSAVAKQFPLIYASSVSLQASADNRYMVSTEGTRLQTGKKLIRVFVSAQSKAEDGMELEQSFSFDMSDESKLPSESELEEALRKVIGQVLALREAPLVEPYSGPAILLNRASGVFFHEIFGHRIEGHRQKNVEEGQTFTKKVGKEILPTFMTVRDDPTRTQLGDIDLRGHYEYDDEGVKAQNVLLVENGVLRTFLLSRSPVEGFPKSNGHGRRAPRRPAVSRQGNLIVESQKQVPIDRLREMLIEECNKQDKPFGYLFEDISGGFTTTSRRSMQSFKVLPRIVWRVYADGRQDELVRGVDIVGTPLSCFENIICTGDDLDVFNGTCGAESGWVPVSAISPSILVSRIEIEKRYREQDKPPILQPPIAESESSQNPQSQGM
jgi:predicted Zn-dependent protease